MKRAIQVWNERYKSQEYVFGKTPNVFYQQEIDKLVPKTILFPADGEGRNSVYAAKIGWNVFAFDISEEGKKKALKLAEEFNVEIDYRVGELPKLGFYPKQFDAIALLYAHFKPEIRSSYHQILIQKLKKGGIVILEAFGKKHLEYKKENPDIGGPSQLEVLFSKEEILEDFKNFEIQLLEETEIALNSGSSHKGMGSVIRFVGKKR